MKVQKSKTLCSRRCRFLHMFYTVDQPDKVLGARINFLLGLVVTTGYVADFNHSFDYNMARSIIT